jgi:putative transposase
VGIETLESPHGHHHLVPPITARDPFSLYAEFVPRDLVRYHATGDLHFITFSCFERQPLLGMFRRRDLFLKVLEQVRRRYHLVVVGYVVMPEHVHLLISEPQRKTLATVIQSLKLGFSRRVLAAARRRRNCAQLDLFDFVPRHIWQKRYYDFNVWTARKRTQKLRYMHDNPVTRGLVGAPELWRWSSYRAYYCGERGIVRVNQWEILKMRAGKTERFGANRA